jgi:hypothetical protein
LSAAAKWMTSFELGKLDYVEKTEAEYSRNYVYSAAGLKINFHDDRLNTISTLPNFDGKTSKGITLRSSLQDIEKTYGLPLVGPGKTNDNAKTWVYDGVIFWLKRSWISNSFGGIDKIVIYESAEKWDVAIATGGWSRVARLKLAAAGIPRAVTPGQF